MHFSEKHCFEIYTNTCTAVLQLAEQKLKGKIWVMLASQNK